MDHTKDDIFEAMNVKAEDYDKLLDAVDKTRAKNATLKGFAKAVEKLEIEDKDKHLSYYLSHVIDTGASEAMQASLFKNLLNQTPTEEIEETSLEHGREHIMKFISMFTLAGSTNTKIATAMAITMSAILLLAIGPEIPRSIIVETIHNGMVINKLSYYEMLKGTMSLLSVITSDENPIKGMLQ